MDEGLKFVLSALSGALTVGFPLWYKIRKAQQKLADSGIDIRAKDEKLELEQRTKEHAFDVQGKIDSEAEWKRILEYRDAELVRLRDRDEQQEKKLQDLYDKHVSCQRNEAAQAERIKMLEAKQDQADLERANNSKEMLELKSMLLALQKGSKHD